MDALRFVHPLKPPLGRREGIRLEGDRGARRRTRKLNVAPAFGAMHVHDTLGRPDPVVLARAGHLLIRRPRPAAPIRVAATDGKTTLYSELVQHTVNTDAGQFVFTKGDVALPGGSGGFTKVYVGFDEGPYNTK